MCTARVSLDIAHPQKDKWISSPSNFFSFLPFNCCLSVVLLLDKEDYPKNLHVVFCPNKQRYFVPFMCLDLRSMF